MLDTAIKSDRIITPEGVAKGFVLIEKGKIVGVQPEMPSVDTYLVNVGDQVVMAGIVDPHVHINDPGRNDWEGFDSATRAAITGGVTTVVDMPLNGLPVTTNELALDQKIAATKGRLHTNCGFWAGLVPGNVSQIEKLVKKGVLGFKAFLTDSGINEFPAVTEKDLREAMPIIAKFDLPLLVHCELTDDLDIDYSSPDRSYRNYLRSRPARWEDNAIALMIRLCEEFKCRTHIVHLSSAESLKQISIAKGKGLPLTVETAQHYLYFNADQVPDGATQFKCAPPIREKENNDRLWTGLEQGLIDFVATDHSPCPPAMKDLISGDFSKAWGGVASIQFALPILWTAAKERGYGLEHIAKWLCEEPAKLIGQSKGKIETGYDADLVIWEPERSFLLKEGRIRHRHCTTPYLNEKLYGFVWQTWLSGRQVFENDFLIGADQGKLVINP
jgi:allantoinase